MKDLDPPGEVSSAPGRWRVLRDLVAFQFKLLLDGLRDLLLSPVSIALALYGVLTRRDNPGEYFYRLMAWGRDTDRWINLFNTHDGGPDDHASADQVVQRAEAVIRGHYDKGGLVKNVKDRTDRALDRFHDRETPVQDNHPDQETPP